MLTSSFVRASGEVSLILPGCLCASYKGGDSVPTDRHHESDMQKSAQTSPTDHRCVHADVAPAKIYIYNNHCAKIQILCVKPSTRECSPGNQPAPSKNQAPCSLFLTNLRAVMADKRCLDLIIAEEVSIRLREIVALKWHVLPPASKVC